MENNSCALLIQLSSIECLVADELIENIFKTSGNLPFGEQRFKSKNSMPKFFYTFLQKDCARRKE